MPVPFTPQYVEVEEKGALMIVTFNRPKAMNSMPPAMHAELSKIWKYYDQNEKLWVAICTGKGRAFSAGFDLKSAAGVASEKDMTADLHTGVTLSGAPDTQGIPGGTGFAGLTERRGVKPIIAAVNGIAHGGGFETALACDIIIACEEADFALPEPRVGLFAAAGGVIRLPRYIGYHNAMEMMMTARRVKGHEAKSMGICSHVVPREQLMPTALAIAGRILESSPDSIQATLQVAKQSLAEEADVVTATKTQGKYPTVRRLNKSPNTLEGPTAFSQKRTPKWVAPAPIENFTRNTTGSAVTIDFTAPNRGKSKL
eukprot:m.89502 g.89502  ORF g.89502 m.89502 type:complete len:314 (-) comp16440_c0_seq1:61-1002(-)